MTGIWQASPPGRWFAAVTAALRGARVHPSASLLGDRAGLSLARGATVSRGCVLRATPGGRITLAAGAWLARDVEVETATHVSIGAGTTIQRRCSILGSTRVGAGCIFAPGVFVSSGTHPFREIPHLPIREQERRLAADGVEFDRPVWIQDDCWIGTNAVVAPGVTVGKGSVIGANSVVTRDVQPYSILAGAPARPIGTRLAWTPPARVEPGLETEQPYILCAADPLLVALRAPAPGERLRVQLECTRPVSVRANGTDVAITPATKDFTVAPAQGLPFGASLRIEVAPPDLDAVRFASFEVVPSTPGA